MKYCNDMEKEQKLSCPFHWIGGKVRIRKYITPLFDKINHTLYVEPFGGSGSVFYGKTINPNVVEVFNDKNGLIANFFQVIRNDQDRTALEKLLALTPYSRAIWNNLREVMRGYESKDDKLLARAINDCNLSSVPQKISLALAFFYCVQCGFGGANASGFGGGGKTYRQKPTTY